MSNGKWFFTFDENAEYPPMKTDLLSQLAAHIDVDAIIAHEG